MALLRNERGQFVPTFNPEEVVGPKKEVSVNDIIRKYGFGIRESSCVADVDYDAESGDMTIIFQQRGTYKYHNVPLDEFFNFQQAASRGQYFNNYVRGTYSYERVG